MKSTPINVDLMLLNAKILTGTNEEKDIDAVAVKNGRILAVGTADELDGLNAKHRIQLNHKVLAPGFIDAHNHFMIYCMWLPYLYCRIPLNGDINELLDKDYIIQMNEYIYLLMSIICGIFALFFLFSLGFKLWLNLHI